VIEMVVVILIAVVKEVTGIGGGGEASERNGDGGRDGRVGRVCENTSEGQGSQGLLELSVIDIQRRVTVGNNASDQKQIKMLIS
jgi:hypothetical protein